MPLIIKKGIPEQVVVSDCGRMAGVFDNGKCLKVFSCDDFDECVRSGKPTPQVEAERFVRSRNEDRMKQAADEKKDRMDSEKAAVEAATKVRGVTKPEEPPKK